MLWRGEGRLRILGWMLNWKKLVKEGVSYSKLLGYCMNRSIKNAFK
jgi:hypothetical protein